LAGVDAQFVALKTIIGAGELPAIKCTSGCASLGLDTRFSYYFFWKASISLVENHRLAKGAGLVEVLECTLMIGQKGLGESGGVSRCSPD
jgi:hypothetical protein